MLRSGKQRAVGKSPTTRRVRPDLQAGRGYASDNRGPFGRGIGYSEAKATIRQELESLKSARMSVQETQPKESRSKSKVSTEKGRHHSDSKSERNMPSDKTYKSKTSRAGSKKSTSRHTAFDNPDSSTPLRFNTRKKLFPTEQEMSRETLESLLQIFAVTMNFSVDKKLLAIFSEIGIKTDKQFIQATCAETADLFTAIFDDDDLDRYTYTSELVAIMIWIREYFVSMSDIYYEHGQFEGDIGYDTLLERGIPTDAELERFMVKRWVLVKKIQEAYLDIYDKTCSGDLPKEISKTKSKGRLDKNYPMSKAIQKQAAKRRVTRLANRGLKKFDKSTTTSQLTRRFQNKVIELSSDEDSDYEPSDPSSSSSGSPDPSYHYHDDDDSSLPSGSNSSESTPSSSDAYAYHRGHKKPKKGLTRRQRYKIPKKIPGMTNPMYPPNPSILRGRHWISRGLRAASSDRRINRRSKLDQGVKWNGTDTTFPRYEHTIEGWMDQNGMGYMNRPDFVKIYKEAGWAEAKYLAAVVSTEQFSQDNEILFGALRSSAQQRGLRYVEKDLDTRDGLKVWLKFKDVFGGDNNLSLKISRLQSELDKPFTDNYHGGFLAYIEQIAYIFSRMDTLDPTCTYHKYSNQKQCDTLRMNFAGDHNYQHITYQYYDEMEQNNRFDLDEYVTRLTKYYQHNEQAFNKTLNRANLVQKDYNIDEDDVGVFGAAYALYQQQQNKPRHERVIDVPNSSFNLFREQDPAFLQEIFEFRQRAENRVRELKDKTEGTGRTRNEQPKNDTDTGKIDINKPQYERKNQNTTRANLAESTGATITMPAIDVSNLNDTDDGTIETTGSETDTGNERFTPEDCAKALAVMKFMKSVNTRRSCHIRTMQLSDRLVRAMRLSSCELESIVDSGADTMVLGEGWTFTYVFPHRTIRIVGFDEAKTKKGCQIGTACTVMHDVNGKPFLMVAHEAIKNDGSNTSLLSEGQMRNAGLIVDSISEQHIGIDDKPGTQSIYSADRTMQFRLQQKFGLMCILHRAPSEDEIATLPRFEITTKATWCPACLNDDTDTIEPYMDEVFETVAVHAYKDDETSTIATDFVTDETPVECILSPDFDPHRVDNPLPAYRKAAKIEKSRRSETGRQGDI